MYQNETEVGLALQSSGIKRDDVFLTTKVHPDNYGADDFADSVRQSLDALKVDQVDLLLLHWPHPTMDMADVLERLIEAKEAGHAKTIGVSNFGPDDLTHAQKLADGKIACNQIELHPFIDQQTTIRAARDLNIKLTAYCPVARGQVLDDATLRSIGDLHRKTAAQIALAWILHQDIAVIPMTRTKDHALANLESRDITLNSQEILQIDALGSPDGKLIDPPGLTPFWGRAN